VWESEVDGKKLTFHLAGINNQNFIMRDDETGAWWQQVSGEAIHGPLKGKKLTQVYNDELTFALWKRENPQGRVLKPDDRVKQKYELLIGRSNTPNSVSLLPLTPTTNYRRAR